MRPRHVGAVALPAAELAPWPLAGGMLAAMQGCS